MMCPFLKPLNLFLSLILNFQRRRHREGRAGSVRKILRQGQDRVGARNGLEGRPWRPFRGRQVFQPRALRVGRLQAGQGHRQGLQGQVRPSRRTRKVRRQSRRPCGPQRQWKVMTQMISFFSSQKLPKSGLIVAFNCFNIFQLVCGLICAQLSMRNPRAGSDVDTVIIGVML